MKKVTTKAVETAATKTGEHLGNKAGEKIVNLLSKKKRKNQVSQLTTPISTTPISTTPKSTPKKLTQTEINQRVNQILSGGKLYRK